MLHRLSRIGWKAALVAVVKALVSVTVVLAASGGLDTTFSRDGKQTTHANAAQPTWGNEAWATAIQKDGKIVVAGGSVDITTEDMALVRYNANGSLDTTFSGDGRLITDLGQFDTAFQVALQPDGKIVVAGATCLEISRITCDVAIVRYRANGALDTTFNGTGKKIVSFNGLNSAPGASGLAIQPDGKIVVSANIQEGDVRDIGVMRFNANGTLDSTFGTGGRKRISFGAGLPVGVSWGRQLALQKDGKIVVGASAGDNFAVARLKSNGALDTTFSGDGRQVVDLGGAEYMGGIAVQPDGKIVQAGDKVTSDADYMAVVRYSTNGTLDRTFNGTGKKTFLFPGFDGVGALAVVVPASGKIVLAGYAYLGVGSTGDFAIARLNANGTFDNTFSADGRAAFDFNALDDVCLALALDGQGRYVLAGYAAPVSGPRRIGVMRLMP